MKIYKHGTKDRNTFLMVQPGADYPHIKEWMTEERGKDGKMIRVPITFNVKFNDGLAEVDVQLGEYCLNKGLAKDSPIAEPEIETPPEFNVPPRPETLHFT